MDPARQEAGFPYAGGFMTTVTIRPTRSDDDGSWDRYVESHPAGSPYHSRAWLKAIESSLGHVPEHLIAESERDIVGILPLERVHPPRGAPRLISVPAANHC